MSTIDNEAFEWVARRFARGLSAPESAQFDAWWAADVRHQGAYARAMAIYNAVNLATGPQSLQATQPAAAPQAASRPGSLRGWLQYGAMAACLVAAVGTLSVSALRDEQVLTTAKGEFRKVPL
ncbi:MAG: DUF4880 domain-containing protein, partial [Lysobacteraceae bacterium]